MTCKGGGGAQWGTKIRPRIGARARPHFRATPISAGSAVSFQSHTNIVVFVFKERGVINWKREAKLVYGRRGFKKYRGGRAEEGASVQRAYGRCGD